MPKLRKKTIETFSLTVHVNSRDIEGGKCRLITKCMHKVAIERELRNIDPKGGDHHVRCDAGLVKLNYQGYRWAGMLPKTPKLNLLKFDKESKERQKAEKAGLKFVSGVKPHAYKLEVVRGSKILAFTRERMEAIYA